MSFTLKPPRQTKVTMATLRYVLGETEKWSSAITDWAPDARAMHAAVEAEVAFREVGMQRPLFVAGRWLVVEGRQWVEVEPASTVRRADRPLLDPDSYLLAQVGGQQ